jgi:cell wall-associated NlpC family hydrolase
MHLQRLATTTLALLLAACASTPHHPTRVLPAADREVIVMTAFIQVGKPYRYGGDGPDAFDCSGLVRYAYGKAGVRVPRTTAELYAGGEVIDLAQAKPGDLLFYRIDPDRRGPSHVVFYLGDGQGIHAPNARSSIRAVNLDIPYFRERYLGARRWVQ